MRNAVFILLLAVSSVSSATDLLTAWQAAREHDPVYRGERAGAQAGRFKERQARALWLPNVGVQAGFSHANARNETRNAEFSAPAFGSMHQADFIAEARSGRETRFGVVVTQPLINAERRASATQLARQSQLSEMQERQSEQRLLLRSARRYVDVLLAEEALATLRAQKAAVRESLDRAKESFAVGKSASTDMHEAQAAFDAILAREYAVRSALELKRAAFSDLTGLPATGLLRLPEAVDLDALRAQALPPLIEQAMAANPEIGMSELAREIAALEIDKYRALAAPTLDLIAQYGRQNIDGRGDSATMAMRSAAIGLQLSIPIFTGGMRGAKYEEALALSEKARYEGEAARQAVTQNLRAADLALGSGLEQARALAQGVLSARHKLDSTRIGHEIGARTAADLLNAQHAYFSVKAELLRARYEILLADLDLAAAAGNLDEARLRRVNAFLR